MYIYMYMCTHLCVADATKYVTHALNGKQECEITNRESQKRTADDLTKEARQTSGGVALNSKKPQGMWRILTRSLPSNEYLLDSKHVK